MSEFDSPWKEALDHFLPWFLQFFFPDAHDDIDWERGYESLDKELAQIVREAESPKRLADKLFKVWRKNGEETWVLIHIEVQAQTEDDTEFVERIYTYNYRIFDRFKRPVASFVVLGDDNPHWRPDRFRYTIWGTEVELTFPIAKLLDYQDRQEELEQHANPFALVVLAHLQSLATRDDADSRRTSKVQLVKNLLDRGLSAEEIRQLFRVIDWVLELPEELSRSFWDEIDEYEKEKQMPVFTSTEKMWLNQGREEGKHEMLLQNIGDYLKAKFGKDGTKWMSAVKEITDVKKLRALQKKLWAANSLADVETLLVGKKRR